MLYFLILIVILIIFSFLLTRLLNKEKWSWKMFFIYFLFFFVFSITSSLMDTKINNPLISFISPPKANIEFQPIYKPVYDNGEQKIMIMYKNIGEKDLHNLVISHFYSPFFPKQITQKLKSSLLVGESGSFLIDLPQKENFTENLTCSMNYGEIKGKYFSKKGNLNECYYDFSSIQDKCSFRSMKINLISKELNQSFSFYYPFKGDTFWITIDGCSPMNQNLNLESFNTCNINVTNIGFYPPSFCEQNLLSSQYCTKHGFDYSFSPLIEVDICGKKFEVSFPTL